jgi:hypothetical protein
MKITWTIDNTKRIMDAVERTDMGIDFAVSLLLSFDKDRLFRRRIENKPSLEKDARFYKHNNKSKKRKLV